MRIENGWLICDTSKYGNFNRVRVSSIDAYTYYTDDDAEKQTHAHMIRFEINGKEIEVYYDGKKKLLEAFHLLDTIMWEYSREVTINDG